MPLILPLDALLQPSKVYQPPRGLGFVSSARKTNSKIKGRQATPWPNRDSGAINPDRASAVFPPSTPRGVSWQLRTTVPFLPACQRFTSGAPPHSGPNGVVCPRRKRYLAEGEANGRTRWHQKHQSRGAWHSSTGASPIYAYYYTADVQMGRSRIRDRAVVKQAHIHIAGDGISHAQCKQRDSLPPRGIVLFRRDGQTRESDGLFDGKNSSACDSA